jgi:glucose/arabinose dehydrogenase
MIRSLHPALVLVIILSLSAGRHIRAEVPLNGLTDAEKRGGWELLFDGTSVESWRNYKQDSISKGWIVKDGLLIRAAAGAGDIITKEQYEHFELSIEYRISKGGNSGIMFHVTEQAARPWHTGPEVQLQDNVDGHDPQKSGWLYQLYKPVKPNWARRFENQVGFKSPEVDDATRPAGQWNHIYLRVTGKESEVALNGVSYFHFNKGSKDWNERVARSKFSKYPLFGKPTRGHICLQDHGNEIAFRNIKVRKLRADGIGPDPIDGKLKLKTVEAFPKLKWEGFKGVDEQGRIQNIRPLEMTHAGDGTNRIFVATQIGKIYVFPNDPDATLASVFLDFSERVQPFPVDDEEGLLGFALHPSFKENGYLYVYYTSREPRVSYLSRFQRSKKDPNKADPDSESVIMRIPQPFANHNGGPMVFGNDGYLYMGLGDGGGRNDPVGHGQNLGTLMGTIIRIDVDKKSAGKNYSIPRDNPFVDREGALPEIYAYGTRNPWRISVDRPTGNIWFGDVGQDLWEEINLLARGANYGWSVREASYNFGNKEIHSKQAPTEAIWEYDHRIGKSITGGHVYRGKALPELQGAYLYADYVTGKIWALKYDHEKGAVISNLGIQDGGIPVLSFGQDEQGEIYYTVQSPSGRSIFKFVRDE